MSLTGGASAAAASQCKLNTEEPLPHRSQEKQGVFAYRHFAEFTELLPYWHFPHVKTS
jgi:hypothetical protein